MLVSRWILVVAIVAAGGCASGGTPTLAQKFVRQGVPSVDMGGPKPKTPSRSERASSPLEHASVTTVSSRISSSASSLENVYPELRDAMWQLRLAPTPAHYMAVARVYRRLGITDTAHDYLARSLAVNGPNPKVLDAMARLWRDWGQPQEGLTYAHRAVYMAPEWAAGQNTLGTVLLCARPAHRGAQAIRAGCESRAGRRLGAAEPVSRVSGRRPHPRGDYDLPQGRRRQAEGAR